MVKKKLLNTILEIISKKKKENNKYKSLCKEEKESKKGYGRNRYKNLKRQAKKINFMHSVK